MNSWFAPFVLFVSYTPSNVYKQLGEALGLRQTPRHSQLSYLRRCPFAYRPELPGPTLTVHVKPSSTCQKFLHYGGACFGRWRSRAGTLRQYLESIRYYCGSPFPTTRALAYSCVAIAVGGCKIYLRMCKY
jgi:hypothetical protein